MTQTPAADAAPLPPESEGVPSIDPVASARWLARGEMASPWLHEEVGRRMDERLGWIQQPPASWLDWSPALGGQAAARLVAIRYPNSKAFLPSTLVLNDFDAPDFEESLWRRLWGRRQAVQPQVLADGGQVGMVWANMVLHAAYRPRVLMGAWLASLQVGGFVMFSGMGPDSLRELRGVYELMHWPTPSHAFTDMHDWGDMLVASGFADPVMDAERLVLTYATAERLLADLRSFGRNLAIDRGQVVRGRGWHQRLCAALESHLPRDADGRLRLTIEVVYGHAYKGQPRHQVASETRVPVGDMRQMLGRRGR